MTDFNQLVKILPNYLTRDQIRELWQLSCPKITDYPEYNQYTYRKYVRKCPEQRAINAFNKTKTRCG